VLSPVKNQFKVILTLTDISKNIISENEYLFLIGDQEKATKAFNQMQKAMQQKNAKYTYGNYYRFFDDMIRENNKDHDSQTNHPKASGY